MKNLMLLVLLMGSLHLSAQKIDGFYSGVLHNDSAKMIQQYELAIAMYKGKVSGYSYVTFVANDTFYYGIRKVKGQIIGDSLVIEDDKFVANNFPESPAKKVKRTISMPLMGQDSVVSLNGTWKTNRTKIYYSVPGKIELAKSSDSLHSPLINHLKELGIIPNQNNYVAVADNKKQREKIKEKEEKPDVVQVKQKEEKAKQKEEKIAKGGKDTREEKMKVAEDKIKIEKEEKAVIANKAPEKLPFDQRKTGATQTFNVSSDSLILSFYDNGVVDGDSISVYMNGQVLVSNARLTTAATKKSVNVAGLDEIHLLLVAENLGSIPPNTGLLTIKDGDAVYQVNFSADMQTNASIVIRRKK